MMVETVLESSQDFSMSGPLPQWKRELLQRRAARSRPAPPPAPPPPPPPPPVDEDEELRYGPGIVKRLKSRYLSLALRDAPRRRVSILRRAASLEHLLEERPPPAPRPLDRPPRPASLAAPALTPSPPVAARRESVKRARSVDALSRLESREESQLQPPPSPPPPPRPPALTPRAPRPPRRPTPRLRETERPPPDLVKSTLRKFEPAPVRRAAPAARVSAALRVLDALQPRTSTPEPRARSPSPTPADLSAIDEPEGVAASTIKPVTRAALEGIARAGSTTRYAFEAPRPGSHLPPLAAANPVLVGRARRVGVIRPMPAPALERAVSVPMSPLEAVEEKIAEEPPRIVEVASRVAEEQPRPSTPTAPEVPRAEKRSSPPSAMVEPIPRSPSVESPPPVPQSSPPPAELTSEPVEAKPDAPTVKPDTPTVKPDTPTVKPDTPTVKPNAPTAEAVPRSKPLVNGHADSKIKRASIERAWSGAGAGEQRSVVRDGETRGAAPWAQGGSPLGARRVRAAPPAAVSVVFNFSARKEVPDYVENDGLILRAARRDRIKAGEPGVVVLRPEALEVEGEAECEGEWAAGSGPPSPCSVRFVNDNVLINGRSSMAARVARDKERIARLKLQFDDSLTRTFEYPSETSLCEETPPAAGSPPASTQLAEPAHLAPLASNTHIASAALSRYTPSKTCADSFQLGVTRHAPPPPAAPAPPAPAATAHELLNGGGGAGDACAEPEARPCGADAARSWSEARAVATDLLF